MRRFLVICVTIVMTYILVDMLVYRTDITLPSLAGNREPEVSVIRFNKELFVLDEQGTWNAFTPRGINLPLSIPGMSRRDDQITMEQWLQWLEQISMLNVNSVRLHTIASQAFYDALYEFNTTHDTPLYLFQGVWVDDDMVRSSRTGYDERIRGQFIKDIRVAVDVVHGHRTVLENNRYGSGNYRRDVSPWTLGYILGVAWNADLVAYTDHIRDDIGGYSGQYLYTALHATPFESFLAEAGDSLLDYETRKYQQQRLVSFVHDVFIDPLEHDDIYSSDRFGVATVDMENILTTERVRSGLFVSYHVYPWSAGFLYGQDSPYYFGQGGVSAYQGYLSALNAYYTLPLVIAEYGYPSSRGLAGYVSSATKNQGNLSETDQGQGIVELYEDIKTAGAAGSFLTGWQDEWNRGAWNTMFSVERTQSNLWHDVQSADQHFGLLSFDPGTESSVCYVDGDLSDWAGITPLRTRQGLSVRAQYDEAYLYLLVEVREEITPSTPLYIALDTTPNSGAYAAEGTDLAFENGVDFLVTIAGRSSSKVEVQAYYEQLRANWWRETYQQDGYEFPPAPDTPAFRPIYLLANPVSKFLDERLGYDDVQLFEAGILVHGNANPTSPSFNSLADYAIAGSSIEIRLPWQLLNFANPAEMMIHDDYFMHYGVQHIAIKQMHIDLHHGQRSLGFATLPLKGWGKEPEFHQRLKASYDIVREAFAVDAAAERSRTDELQH